MPREKKREETEGKREKKARRQGDEKNGKRREKIMRVKEEQKGSWQEKEKTDGMDLEERRKGDK